MLETAREVYPVENRVVATNLSNLGRFRCARNRLEEGDRILRQALVNWSKREGKESADFAYRKARYHARTGDAEKAVAALRMAVQRDLLKPERIFREADLRSLQDRSDFQAIVRALDPSHPR